MKGRKIASLGLSFAMVLSMVACGGGNTNTKDTSANSGETTDVTVDGGNVDAAGSAGVRGSFEDPANTEKTDETIVIGLASEPAAIYGPGAGLVANETSIIQRALADGLVVMDQKTGDVKPCLATEWEWVDSTHCKFTLRDDVVMSDGTPLVADDVVYTVNEIWKGINATNDTGNYIGEGGAVAEDEHTVTIEFSTPAPDLLAMLTWSNFGIVSEDEVNAAGGPEAFSKKPIGGCGRYVFKDWVNGQYITLERNENYWDDSYAGYYKDIKLTFVADAAAREFAVESGDADVAYDIPVSQVVTFTGKDNADVVLYPIGQITHLWFNMGDNAQECLKDARVRKAIDLAFNYDAINAVGSAGYGEPVYGYFESNSKYYNATYTDEDRAVDVEQAKALLDEAGYKDGDITLTALGLQDCVPVYTVMQENLHAIGINLEMDIPDVPSFVQSAAGGNYDLILVGDLVSARYPTLMLSLRMDGAYGFSIGGPKYSTEETDAAIHAAIEETDEAKAKEMFGELEQQFKEDTMYVNLYQELKGSVVGSKIKGYTNIERGYVDITNFYK